MSGIQIAIEPKDLPSVELVNGKGIFIFILASRIVSNPSISLKLHLPAF